MPRKTPQLVEATSMDEVHAPTFNILTKTPPSKNNEIPAKGGSSQLKISQAKKIVSPANQKGKKRKVKIVEVASFDSDSNFVDKHMTELKAYVDNSTKLIIDEIRSSRGQPTQTSHQEVKNKFEPQMDFGDVKVSKMNFFNIMVKTGRPWEDGHYGRTKNDDGAISESEVTGTIASKFGGPPLAKQHAPDTSNYPTPRSRLSNLR
ncbi:hypothetical protein H5410_016037 [Solanum commersonii]|uniref:Uncharacterized protein n=1 Tax=Solanum commersonii TaxID=4109 RepID=A0A9J5ZV53_SOLCO|nr:hypothetical protein H5410_016037 [Solanum commersonii]